MPKAILELFEMPESCSECPIMYREKGLDRVVCVYTMKGVAGLNDKRDSRCPLIPVEK